MSLTPPPPERSEVGDVWVDPITADRWEFTGDETQGVYGWVNVGPNEDHVWTLAAADEEYTRRVFESHVGPTAGARVASATTDAERPSPRLESSDG